MGGFRERFLGGGITVLAPALGVHLSFGRLSGGLCCAATTGYFLATLRVAGKGSRLLDPAAVTGSVVSLCSKGVARRQGYLSFVRVQGCVTAE